MELRTPRYMTLQETAEYLALPLSMIYRLSSEGRLPGKVTWGVRTIRVDRQKLDAWVDAQEVEADATR